MEGDDNTQQLELDEDLENPELEEQEEPLLD